jgi:DoxX-like family
MGMIGRLGHSFGDLMGSRSLFIATQIHTDIDRVWDHTQTPSLHERWDLRFSTISYLPKSNPNDPQQFEYATQIFPGIRVVGWGESVATKVIGDSSTSSLKFGSGSPISLIREGSGYWKYTVEGDEVAFETGYDYSVRWGLIGRIVDALIFRPLIGFATAWSFDRLRLWLEEEIDPTLSMLRALVHSVSRIALVFVFLWHGLVPKLILRHPEELRLIEASGFSQDSAQRLLTLSGWLEVGFALLLVLLWNARWLYLLTGALLVALLIPAIRADSSLISDPFTPITLTTFMLTVCILGWVSCVKLPKAGNCSRTKAGFAKRRNSV